MTHSVGFIGAGQMAQALARGFLAARLLEDRQIYSYDPAPAAREQFLVAAPGATIHSSGAETAAAADVIILAVKPQSMDVVLSELAPVLSNPSSRSSSKRAEKLVVSIAAGVTLDRLSSGLGYDRLVRVMPNTPCLVGQGAAGFSLGAGAQPEDGQLVETLLSSVGVAFEVEEKLLDAVTGLSGSGPAYVMLMIEALSDGGVRMGLPRPIAAALAAQTVRGAAALLLETGEHPAQLKDRVASPGGTTIAGLQALEEKGLRAALIAAVEAATNRSRELGAS